MQIPLQITFRDMDPSPAIDERIRQQAVKLEQFHERISGCRVVVEASHRRHRKGNGLGPCAASRSTQPAIR